MCEQERGQWCHRWVGGRHANERWDGGVTDGQVDNVQTKGDGGHSVTDGQHANKKGQAWCDGWVGIMQRERERWDHRWATCK